MEIKNYIFEQDNLKHFAVLKFLKDLGVNRSVINNKKWANPIFRKHCKIISFKGKKGQSRMTMMPLAVGIFFLLTIKIYRNPKQAQKLLEIQSKILDYVVENPSFLEQIFC